MKITKKTQYGLRAMIFLAKNKNKVFSLSEIAKREKVPINFLEKIFLQLNKAGLVKTKRGIQGGYYIAKSPENIRVIKIIENLEGKLHLVKCLSDFCPHSKSCSAKKCWQKLQKSIKAALSSLTLADLI